MVGGLWQVLIWFPEIAFACEVGVCVCVCVCVYVHVCVCMPASEAINNYSHKNEAALTN